MQLMMFIGNDLIESVHLDDESIPVPGYLGSYKRKLKMKYSELIQEYNTAPEFLVADPAIPKQKQVSKDTENRKN